MPAALYDHEWQPNSVVVVTTNRRSNRWCERDFSASPVRTRRGRGIHAIYQLDPDRCRIPENPGKNEGIMNYRYYHEWTLEVNRLRGIGPPVPAPQVERPRLAPPVARALQPDPPAPAAPALPHYEFLSVLMISTALLLALAAYVWALR
jgi:hypothetical protein